MNKKVIIADSACDLNKELKNRMNIESVSFHIDIEGESILDDESTNRKKFLKTMEKTTKRIGSAAPSPNQFMEKFGDYEEIFIVTISKKLSGTYGNAVLAKNIFLENSNTKVHVFDSKSAGSGETVVALKIQELLDEGLSFEVIVEKVEKFISEMKTYFILDSFENLIKNGRVSVLKGKLASILSFKPVMCGVDGEIEVYAKTRGYVNALKKLYEAIGAESKLDDRNLIISHCDALDTAKKIKNSVEQKFNFKSIQIVETGLLTSVYANKGGVIICF
ncbi:MAG: DegV family protein [Lagierella massiliensis]|nr:DegV family protein [Lagierella massiliensis]